MPRATSPRPRATEIQRFKWATSAAHVAGRRLVSAEAATWLGEHFRVRARRVRAAVDRFFLAGVNHIVYHGTAYSPDDEPWPGWQFYASVEFNPQNAWWDDFGALNGYVARVQSFMQTGRPDNDVLLYYPFYESLSVRGQSRLAHFGGAAPPAQGTTFEKAAEMLQAAGFTYDFVSDRQVQRLEVANGRVTSEGGAVYRAVVLPAARYIPLETLEQVIGIARSGATVVSLDGWPADVSGLNDLDARRARFKTELGGVSFGSPGAGGISEAVVGRGRILQGPDLGLLLARAGVQREPMVDRGLQFARRADAMGRIYFVSNPGGARDRRLDSARQPCRHADGVRPDDGRSGRLTVRASGGAREVYLQIGAGGSLIVAESPTSSRETFDAFRAAGEPIAVAGPWTVAFVKGGPRLPARRVVDCLASWTHWARRRSLLGHCQLHDDIPAAEVRRTAMAARPRPRGRERAGPPERTARRNAHRPVVSGSD